MLSKNNGNNEINYADEDWQAVIENSWNNANPDSSELLSDLEKTKYGKSVMSESLKYWFNKINYIIFPFHHLVSAAQLTETLLSNFPEQAESFEKLPWAKQSQLVWQLLAAKGRSPREAVLFDDNLECRLHGFDQHNKFFKINFNVSNFDALCGCSEVYRAEMLVLKRKIYEAEKDVRAVIEVSETELLKYLKENELKPLYKNFVEDLFFGSLSSTYQLSIRSDSQEIYLGGNKQKRKPTSATPEIFIEQVASRIEKWLMRSEKIRSVSSPKKYRVRLTPYWLDWQRAATTVNFDFDVLETLTDIRAIRFYELTKLLRVQKDENLNGKILDKLEINYHKFASLMPLPKLNTDYEIKAQIQDLIKSLKRAGYIKSFSYKNSWHGDNDEDKLRFRFHN